MAFPRSSVCFPRFGGMWFAGMLILAPLQAGTLAAQAQNAALAPLAAAAPTAVPALVPYSGTALNSDGKPLSGEKAVTFLIYKDEAGGEPLFTETQTVTPDAIGHYQVNLGATLANGLPSDLFATGEARWLDVQVAGAAPQPRVLLVSVPYALKAADAATLGGLPPSAFALVGTASSANPVSGVTPATASNVTTNGGVAGYVPQFSGASSIVDSPLFASGAKVGIGTAAPLETLDVRGTAVSTGLIVNGVTTFGGAVEVAPVSFNATTATGYNSQLLKLAGSAYNSASKAIVNPRFVWQATVNGNNTAAPSATLELLSSTTAAVATPTGFSFNPNGTINFAAGQTFPAGPGAGTITGVTAGTALTGGGTTGNVTLNVDTTKVALLNAANTFAGNQSVTGNISATGGANFDTGGKASTGLTSLGTTTGIFGQASGTATNSAGVFGSEIATTGQVYGVSGNTGSKTNYAAGVNGYESAVTGQVFGVSGTTSSTTAQAAGVTGFEGALTGLVFGVTGGTNSSTNAAAGVQGSDNATTGIVYGVAGYANSTTSNAAGVRGYENALTGQVFGVQGSTNSTTNYAAGVSGYEGAATGTVFGVTGGTSSTGNGSAGLSGNESALTGTVYGVSGNTNSTTNFSAGVSGYEGATTGQVWGVQGGTNSTSNGSAGVLGNANATTGAVSGVQGGSNSATANAAGVSGYENATTGQVYGINGSTSSTGSGAAGVNGYEGATTGAVWGVSGGTNSSNGAGVLGSNNSTTGGNGVQGVANASNGNGVLGQNNATSGFSVGVTGYTNSPGGAGLNGFSNAASGGIGVNGNAPTGGTAIQGGNQACSGGTCTIVSGIAGLFSTGSGGTLLLGLSGSSLTTQTTRFSVDAAGDGFFAGNLNVTGKLTKGSGSFKIDDPLDPADKYLSHSFVESPDMMNVYNGNITTDKRGMATVELPEYFDALNRDFRYQLTVMGQFAQAIVAKKIAKNRFVIRTSKPNVEVSWQVTGIRQDAYANANRIPVEENKPADERGYYLHPEVFGQPASRGIVAAAKPAAYSGSSSGSR